MAVALAASACSDALPPLAGELIVEPSSAYEGVETEIHIHGEAIVALVHINYSDPAASTATLDVTVTLGGTRLQGVHMIERGVIAAIVPATFPRGEHTLTITDAAGRSISKPAAFRTEPMPIEGPPGVEAIDPPAEEPTGTRAVCGDGAVHNGEDCDDGALQPGDGCSPACTVEDGWVCSGAPSVCQLACGDGVLGGSEQCDDQNQNSGDGCTSCAIELGFACAGSPSVCTPDCGDGALSGSETCDDGAWINGDGCTAACALEPGWTCPTPGLPCVTICGDGILAGIEVCDDGNISMNDGCNNTCTLEQGWTCPDAGEPCVPICGDGILRGNEPCDDSNLDPGDGCSSICEVEPGFDCLPSRTICNPICGDGLMRGGELCDDGDLAGGDGCGANCTLEPGWECPIEGQPCTPICGDGVTRGQESCDDGNGLANDGCSATCRVEIGFVCATPGQACTPICGDGRVRGGEPCDDGDLDNGDGCSATCTVETGFTCPNPGLACVPICGNGLLHGNERCDDGNSASNDGCSASCAVEAGYTCPVPGSACIGICGDGLIRGGEICDDGNSASNDGCDSVCLLEDGFTCSAPNVPCIPICGDQLPLGNEGCDDGNTVPNDGCSATCQVEPGYTCSFRTACAPTCGDGLLRGNENCDDANNTAGDGCSATCTRETGWVCPIPSLPCAAICGDNLQLGAETCDDGNTVAGDGCSIACAVEPGYTCPIGQSCAPTCGDGLLRGNEACDDGNRAGTDGCNASCTAIELGWTCAVPNTPCAPICGDNRLRGAETCDDGNTAPNDGCSVTCTVEQGWTCPAGINCAPICGDFLRRGGEACDDGNTTSGDGCTSACATEVGFNCPTAGGACSAICGDGLVRGDEGCDDGNLAANDGCNLACDVEASFDCVGSPSVCSPYCGNRRADPGEGCDDGNIIGGDGCSSTCTIEGGYTCARFPTICVATAGTVVVDDGAVCPGSGTNALPYCSLASAVSAMSARIVVRPGEYRETIDLNGRTVDLIADDGALLIPSDSAASPALRIRGASTVNITGLTITGGTVRASLEGGTVSIALSQIGPGANGAGIETSGNARLTLTQSRVSGNAGGGVSLGGSTAFTLSGNVIAHNGAAVGPQFGGVRVIAAPAGSRLINNTVVYNTSAAGTTAGVRCDVAGSTMISSVVYGNLANTTASSASANCSPTYSSLTPSVAGTGNITGDPQLLAPNYSLLPASALIDAGDPAGIAPAGSAPAFEYDGSARVATDRPDIGAYEYSALRYVEREMTSLTTLDGGNYLNRYQRGLFRGTNQVPTAHRAAGLARAQGITPRAMDGSLSSTGRYVMLTIGGSDIGQAYCTDDPMTPPNTVFPEVQVCTPHSMAARFRLDPVEAINRTTFYHVNGAYPNQYAENFTQDDDVFPPIPADPFVATANGNYDRIRDHILPYYVPPGLSEAQVEILFVELYNRRPQASLPDRHSDVTELMVRLGNVIRLAKARYPNLQMAFITSRTYAGVNTVRGPGEPFAYETGLAVKALVEAQMAQMENAGTIVDPRAGDLNYATGAAPWISWGPYLWANGTRGLDNEPRWSAGDFELNNPNGYYTDRGIAKAEIIMARWFELSPFTKCWLMANALCQ